MKKIIFTFSLCIVVSSVFLYSCKKKLKEDEQFGHNSFLKSNARVDAQNGRLVFETIEEFDSVVGVLSAMYIDTMPLSIIDSLDNWENQYSYTSLRNYVNNDSSLLPGNDFILGTLLNNRSIIQIQGYIFKVLANDTFIYSLNVDSMTNEDYTYLIEGNYAASQRIMQHTYNEDVFETLGLWGWGCGESNRSTQYQEYNPTNLLKYGSLYYRVQFRCKYFNFGVYSQLKAEWHLQISYNGVNGPYYDVDNSQVPPNYTIQIDAYSLRKPKCKNCQSSYMPNFTFNSYHIQKQYHYSTIGLHYFKIASIYKYKYENSGWATTNYYIFESWKQNGSSPCG